MSENPPVVVVTGANGLVGSRVCAALAERGATVRAVVRRPGSAPSLDGVEERVGEFTDPGFAAPWSRVRARSSRPCTRWAATARPSSRSASRAPRPIAEAAAAAGVDRLVHVSTAAVYDRSPGVGDVDEDSALVAGDANDYAVTKRDTDVALAGIGGLTRVLLRPPAILGPGDSSIWNTLRPATIRDDERARHANPDASFAWVHVDDLAAFAADLASGRVAVRRRPGEGPGRGGVHARQRRRRPGHPPRLLRHRHRALGLDPVWHDRPAWTGRILADRARAWGWTRSVDLATALAEIDAGLRG